MERDGKMIEQLDALLKAIEAGFYKKNDFEKLQKALSEMPVALSMGVALKVTEHMNDNKHLSPVAREALSKMDKVLLAKYDQDIANEKDGVYQKVSVIAQCQYYALRVTADQVEKGIEAISGVINELAAVGAIHSCLAPVSSLSLALQLFEKPTVVVFCFVHIKPEFKQMAENIRYRVLEGGVGEAIVDLSVDLEPGEFLAGERICHFSLDGKKGKLSNEALIYKRVNEYLKYLPEGTEFRGYRECAVMDLSIPVELKFYHPYFINVKRVDLEYVRDCAYLESEPEGRQLKEFNKFIGMRYYQVNPITKVLEWFPPLDIP